MTRRVAGAALGALVLLLVWLALSTRMAVSPGPHLQRSDPEDRGTIVEWRLALDDSRAIAEPGVSAADDPSAGSPPGTPRDADRANEPVPWRTTTDLGYEVRVSHGWLVTFRAELLPCSDEHEHAAKAPFSPALPTAHRSLDLVLDRYVLRGTGSRRWPMAATISAGHGDDEPGETRTRTAFVESLTPRRLAGGFKAVLDTVRASGGPYCRVHYLLGPATAEAAEIRSGLEMSGISLMVEGVYRAPGSVTEQSFGLSSDEAVGAFLPLCGVAGDCTSPKDLRIGPVIASITVRRDLGGLFDGIDLATVDDATSARTVLRNAAEGARAIISDPVPLTSADSAAGRSVREF